MSEYLETLVENMLADNVSENDIRKVIEEITKKSPLRQGVVGTTGGVSTTQEGIVIGEQGEIIKEEGEFIEPEIKTDVEVVEETDKTKCEKQDGMCWDEQRSRCARCQEEIKEEVDVTNCDPDGSKRKDCEDEGGTFRLEDCGCTAKEELKSRIKEIEKLDLTESLKESIIGQFDEEDSLEEMAKKLSSENIKVVDYMFQKYGDFFNMKKGQEEQVFSNEVYNDIFGGMLNYTDRHKIYDLEERLRELEGKDQIDTEEYKNLRVERNLLGTGEVVNELTNPNMSYDEFVYHWLKNNPTKDSRMTEFGTNEFKTYKVPDHPGDIRVDEIEKFLQTSWGDPIDMDHLKLIYSAYQEYHKNGYISKETMNVIDETPEGEFNRYNKLFVKKSKDILKEIIKNTIGWENWDNPLYKERKEIIIDQIEKHPFWLAHDVKGERMLIRVLLEDLLKITAVGSKINIAELTPTAFKEFVRKTKRIQTDYILSENALYNKAKEGYKKEERLYEIAKKEYNKLKQSTGSLKQLRELNRIIEEHKYKMGEFKVRMDKHRAAYNKYLEAEEKIESINFNDTPEVKKIAIATYFGLGDWIFEPMKRKKLFKGKYFRSDNNEYFLFKEVQSVDNYWEALEEYLINRGGESMLIDFERSILKNVEVDGKKITKLNELPSWLPKRKLDIELGTIPAYEIPDWLLQKLNSGTLIDIEDDFSGLENTERGKEIIQASVMQVKTDYLNKEMYNWLDGWIGREEKQRLLTMYIKNPYVKERTNSAYINNVMELGRIDEILYARRFLKDKLYFEMIKRQPGIREALDIQNKPQLWGGRWYISVKHRLQGVRTDPTDDSILIWPEKGVDWIAEKNISDNQMILKGQREQLGDITLDLTNRLKALNVKEYNIDGVKYSATDLLTEEKSLLIGIQIALNGLTSTSSESEKSIITGMVNKLAVVVKTIRDNDLNKKMEELFYDLSVLEGLHNDNMERWNTVKTSTLVASEWKKDYSGEIFLGAKTMHNLHKLVNNLLIAVTAGQSDYLLANQKKLINKGHTMFAQPYKLEWGNTWSSIGSAFTENVSTLVTMVIGMIPLPGMRPLALSMFFGQSYGQKYVDIEALREQSKKERKRINELLDTHRDNKNFVIKQLQSEGIPEPNDGQILNRAELLDEESKKKGGRFIVLQQWEVNQYTDSIDKLEHRANMSELAQQSLSFLTGLAEVGFEYLGFKFLDNIMDVRRVVGAELSLLRKIGKAGWITSTNQVMEVGTETLTQMTHTLFDNWFKINSGDDTKSLFDGLNAQFFFDVYALTLFMSSPGVLMQAGTIIKSEFRTKKEKKRNNELITRVKEIEKELDKIDKTTLNGNGNPELDKKKNELINEQRDLAKKISVWDMYDILKLKNFSENELHELADLARRKKQIINELQQLGFKWGSNLDTSKQALKEKERLLKEHDNLQLQIDGLVESLNVKNKPWVIKDGKKISNDYTVPGYSHFYYAAYLADIEIVKENCRRNGNLFNKVNEENTIFNKETEQLDLTKKYEAELLEYFTKKRKLTKKQTKDAINLIKKGLRENNNASILSTGDIFAFTENAFNTIYNTPLINKATGKPEQIYTEFDAMVSAASGTHEIFHNWHIRAGLVVGGKLRSELETAVDGLHQYMLKQRDAKRVSDGAWEHYMEKYNLLQNNPHASEELMNLVGQMMHYGAIDRGSFIGTELAGIKLLLGDLFRLMAGKPEKMVIDGVEVEVVPAMLQALQKRLVDFSNPTQVYNYISHFYKKDPTKLITAAPIIEPPLTEEIEIKSSEGKLDYRNKLTNLQNQVKVLKETKPTNYEIEVAVLEDEIKKMQKNLDISDRNAINIDIYQKEMAKFEKNPSLGKSSALIRAEAALLSDNIGIIEDFFLNNYDAYKEEFSGISESDFRSAMSLTIATIMKNYDKTIGTDFGYYLKNSLSFQQGNILKAAAQGYIQPYRDDIDIENFELLNEGNQQESDDMGVDDLYDLNNIETVVETGEFRKLVGFEEGSPLYKEFVKWNKEWIANNLNLEINGKEHRKAYKEFIIPKLKKKVQKMVGTMKSDQRRDFLKLNGQKIIDLLVAKHVNRFDGLAVKGPRMTVPLSNKMQGAIDGVFVKNTKAGNILWFTKKFEISEQERENLKDAGFTDEFIDGLLITQEDFLNYFMTGRETQSKALVEELTSELGIDGLMDALVEANPTNVELYIEQFTNHFKRDRNIKFSAGKDISGFTYLGNFSLPLHYDTKNLKKNCLNIYGLVKQDGVELEDVFDVILNEDDNTLEIFIVGAKPVADKPGVYYHKDIGEFTSVEAAFMHHLLSTLGDSGSNARFITKVKNSGFNKPVIDRFIAQTGRNNLKNNPNATKKYLLDLRKFVKKLDPRVLKIFPKLEIFGLHYDILDSAETKIGPKRSDGISMDVKNKSHRGESSLLVIGWKFDPNLNGGMFIKVDTTGKKVFKDGKLVTSIDPVKNENAIAVTGKYYNDLIKLQQTLNNSKVETETDFDAVSLYNKMVPGGIFQRLDKIIDGPGTVQKKLQEIQRELGDEIAAANIANIDLATDIVTTAIESVRDGTMRPETFLSLLQLQTGITLGLRSTSRLDFITLMAAIKEKTNKGGEHMDPNANLMFELVGVMFRYIDFDANGIRTGFRENIDIRAEVNKVLQKHTQWYTQRDLMDLIDRGGKEDGKKIFQNSDLGIRRLIEYLTAEHQQNIYSPVDGLDMMEKIIQLESEMAIQNQMAELQQQQEIIEQINKEENETLISDFDDTINVKSDHVIIATKGKIVENIPAKEFPNRVNDLIADGYEFSFKDFDEVKGGDIGLFFDNIEEFVRKSGPEAFVVLTNRQPEAAWAIKTVIDQELAKRGLDVEIPIENIVTLGGQIVDGKEVVVTPADKVNWIKEYLSKGGFNKIVFADDSVEIVKAVRKMLLDFPYGVLVGETILVKEDFLKTKTTEGNEDIEGGQIYSKSSRGAIFNDIIFQKTGIPVNEIYSEARGRLEGLGQSKFRLFLSPSAQDFEGLLYSFLTKGEKGVQQLEWFKENIIQPYSRGMNRIASERRRVQRDYKKLKKQFKKAKKQLSRKVPGAGDFTFDHAIRVYLWNKSGVAVPGLAKDDPVYKALVNAVANDPVLVSFAEQLNVIAQHDGVYVKPTEMWSVENIALDIQKLTEVIGRDTHLQDFKTAREEIFGNWEKGRLIGPNMNKIEAVFSFGFRDALTDILFRMEFGYNRQIGQNKQSNTVKNFLNGAVGTVMFWNRRSALLQTLSTFNFIKATGPSSVYQSGKTLLEIVQYFKDAGMILNSDWLWNRIKGKRIGVNEAEFAEWMEKGAAQGLGWGAMYKRAFAWLIDKGYSLTQAGDALAIIMGGAIYIGNMRRYYIPILTKKKEIELDRELTKEELAEVWIHATNLAFESFVLEAESGQQSSRADQISQEYASDLGRLLFNFKITPQQYTRRIEKAILDMLNKRGNPAQHVATVAYYGLVQNFIFNALQMALFAAALDGDEEDMSENLDDVMNGMLDSILDGMGLKGVVIATVKNGVLEFIEQEEKDWNADHTNTIIEFAGASPVIGIKLRQIYSAIQTKKYNKEVIDYMSIWDPLNPQWVAIANVITAFTNIPAEEVVNVMTNIFTISNGENEWWQNLAIILGWSEWNVDAVTEVDLLKEEIRKKKLEIKEIDTKNEKLKEIQLDVEGDISDELERVKNKLPAVEYNCAYVNSENKRCGIDVEDAGQLCSYHDPKNAEGCKQMKSPGNPCKNTTTNESGYCWLHNDGKF